MITAVLQARMSSSRLPGKVLMPIVGKPMLGLQLERIRRARRVNRLIVATSNEPADASVVELCNSFSIPSYCGSLNDVLDRCHSAVASSPPEYVVRLTGDCPLADWSLIDRAIAFCIEGKFDYASNTLRPTWPDGLDVEVMRFDALDKAWREAKLPSEREHVTPYMYRRPDRFRLGSLEQEPDLSGLRWTVDEPEDFEFVSQVYEALYPSNPAFTTGDILKLLRSKPALRSVNSGFVRNEGMSKSLATDRAFKSHRRE
jgi:spore coat polysaccharide biosynthesis protein SpsF